MKNRRTQRRQRLTAFLVVVLCLLAGVIAAVQWQDRRDAAGHTFLASDTGEAAANIRIDRPDRDAIVITRESGSWQIQEPCRVNADDQRLASLFEALTSSPLDYPAAEVDREAAGLLDPQARLLIDGEDVLLGSTDLSGERRYAQRGGRVALVPEWVLSLVNGGLSALATRELFEVAATSLTIDDMDVADMNAWLALSATQIVDWPLKDAPPETSRSTLRARLSDDRDFTADIVSNDTWTAVIATDGDSCARLFANDDIPAPAGE